MTSQPENSQMQYDGCSSSHGCNGVSQAAMYPSSHQSMDSQAMPQHSYDSEAQSPTHDALSRIYNDGY
jgi:hypothetical protein